MNFWGFLGLLFIWIAGYNHTDPVIFVCSICSSIVFFVISIFRWVDRQSRVYDDDDYD